MKRRSKRGSFFAEFPLVIWILLLVLTFPLLNFATISLRSTFLIAAVRDAVHTAARSKTFRTSLSQSDPSAQVAATNQVNATIANYREITISSVTTRMVICDLNTQQVTRRTTPLTAPADTDDYTYSIEVTVVADVRPLLSYNHYLFGNIPGLSRPVRMAYTAQEFCEYPDGLTQ